MSKLQQYSLVFLRLAFLAASLPVPAMLHGQGVIADSTPAAPAISTDSQVTVTAKEPGSVRIGVALPGSDLTGANLQTSAAALQEAEVRSLTGPKVEAVALHASNSAAVVEEAKARNCDLILTSSITQKAPAQSRFSKLGGFKTLQLAATAAQFIPVVSVPAMIATAAGSQLASLPLANLTNQVKAGTDISLQYALIDMNNHAVVSGEEKAHSKADGDDVLTPLLTSATAKVLKAAQK